MNEQAMLAEAFAPIRSYINSARKAGATQLNEVREGATDYSYQTSSRWVFFTLDDDIEVTQGFGVLVVAVGFASDKKPRFETYSWDGEAARNEYYRGAPAPEVHESAKAALKTFMGHLKSHLSYMAREVPSIRTPNLRPQLTATLMVW